MLSHSFSPEKDELGISVSIKQIHTQNTHLHRVMSHGGAVHAPGPTVLLGEVWACRGTQWLALKRCHGKAVITLGLKSLQRPGLQPCQLESGFR